MRPSSCARVAARVPTRTCTQAHSTHVHAHTLILECTCACVRARVHLCHLDGQGREAVIRCWGRGCGKAPLQRSWCSDDAASAPSHCINISCFLPRPIPPSFSGSFPPNARSNAHTHKHTYWRHWVSLSHQTPSLMIVNKQIPLLRPTNSVCGCGRGLWT